MEVMEVDDSDEDYSIKKALSRYEEDQFNYDREWSRNN